MSSKGDWNQGLYLWISSSELSHLWEQHPSSTPPTEQWQEDGVRPGPVGSVRSDLLQDPAVKAT